MLNSWLVVKIMPNGCKYIVVLMQYICCYSLVKLLFYHKKINMKITLIPVVDTPCVCKACKKDFIIPKEKMLEDYRQCTWCGSLKWKYKDSKQ
jgi:hypothetical protein